MLETIHISHLKHSSRPGPSAGSSSPHSRGYRQPKPERGCGPTVVCTMGACLTTGPLPGRRGASCRVLGPHIRTAASADEVRRARAGLPGAVGEPRVPSSHRGVTRPVHRGCWGTFARSSLTTPRPPLSSLTETFRQLLFRNLPPSSPRQG